ncbi:ferritin family protein [Desulfoscipio geothermicus]|uniref:Rubrerythrin n=1 Tax=Desulfoscipio geothermicus DSM 3669 TaxID=1121426 RepID=A0A1I6ED78_9FIRM|nr:ferritin family protein [Desulfoscipio geothermicus]SFR15617.1 Rubrerythrin [Desulfoscipio geothermicus DSM 3669]
MSGNELTEVDVYKIALTNELRGASFYSSMAAKSRDQRTKDIFHKLAEEEKEHHKLFQNMLELAEKKPANKPLNRGTASYLKTLVQNNVFPVDIEGLARKTSPEQALVMGIQAEKDSILLYQELYSYTDNENVKDMLSKLLQEEKIHLVELREQYEEMQNLL